MALYSKAKSCAWVGDMLRLDSGEMVRGGALEDPQGKRLDAARPMQMFTRWYGFAYTFPECEIYQD